MVYTTLVPEQTDAAGEVVKVGVGLTFTVIVVLLLAAGLPVAQGVALEVSTTETTSPFKRVVLVNVALFVPVFTPFNFH